MPSVPAPRNSASRPGNGKRKDVRAERTPRTARTFGQAAFLGGPTVPGETHAASRPIAPANAAHETLEDLADEPIVDTPVASDEKPDA